MITLALVPSSQNKLLMCMDPHSWSIRMLVGRNMASMLLTAGHSIKAVAEAVTEAMDAEVKEAVVDAVILLQPLMESISLTPVIHL